MTDLTIDGDTFRVEIDGDPTRPALLLSNSLGTDLTMWDGQMAALTTHFRVVRYDSRGHGGSALGSAPASMARLGRDALGILDALEIETAHFIGLSMGGAVGLWLLAHAPARIGRAVLANTAPKLGDADTWNARIADVLANGMEANATATIERWLTPAFASREPRTAGAIDDMLRRTSPDGYAFCCAALRDMDLRAALATIRHEVLVVTGTEDPVLPEADAAAFVAGLAGARHVALEARHLSNVEAAAAFDAAVIAFLTAKPARRAPAKPAPAKAKPSAQPAASVSTSKRGGAGRRSNPARRPLKATAKRAPKKAAKPRADTRRRPPATKPRRAATAAKRAPGKAAKPLAAKPLAAKSSVSKSGVSKTGAKAATRKAAAKKKPTTTRRPTPAAAARAPVKKAKPRKVAAKKAVKPTPAAKGVAKKIPPTRRKSVTKPRRPTGRRKR